MPCSLTMLIDNPHLQDSEGGGYLIESFHWDLPMTDLEAIPLRLGGAKRLFFSMLLVQRSLLSFLCTPTCRSWFQSLSSGAWIWPFHIHGLVLVIKTEIPSQH